MGGRGWVGVRTVSDVRMCERWQLLLHCNCPTLLLTSVSGHRPAETFPWPPFPFFTRDEDLFWNSPTVFTRPVNALSFPGPAHWSREIMHFAGGMGACPPTLCLLMTLLPSSHDGGGHNFCRKLFILTTITLLLTKRLYRWWQKPLTDWWTFLLTLQDLWDLLYPCYGICLWKHYFKTFGVCSTHIRSSLSLLWMTAPTCSVANFLSIPLPLPTLNSSPSS